MKDKKIFKGLRHLTFHEIGHMFSLLQESREGKNSEYIKKYGRHCTNKGCSMVLGVVNEEIQSVEVKLEAYCNDCIKDLYNHFGENFKKSKLNIFYVIDRLWIKISSKKKRTVADLGLFEK